MKARHPGTFGLVCAAHAVLAWALLALEPGRSSSALQTRPPVGQGLISVALHPAPASLRAIPTAIKATQAPPSRRERLQPLLSADAARDMPMVVHAEPAVSDAAAGRAVRAEPQPIGTPPPERTAAASSAEAEPAPPTAPVVPPARAELPATVSAHADRRLCPPAPHPAVLRERGIEGAVVLRVKVDVQGRPADVQMLAGSGWRLFDEAAMQQVRACRFFPATQGGQAIDSWVEFPVRFALAG